jgi:hypothetical protein
MLKGGRRDERLERGGFRPLALIGVVAAACKNQLDNPARKNNHMRVYRLPVSKLIVSVITLYECVVEALP